MVIYFKILKYLFAGALIGLLLYLILSNITVTIEFDESTYPPCPYKVMENDEVISCPSQSSI